jgi:hypothetical protein
MNTAFKRGKLAKYCNSRFYIKYCRNNNLSFGEWISLQDKRTQNNILGKAKAKMISSNLPYINSELDEVSTLEKRKYIEQALVVNCCNRSSPFNLIKR